MSKKTTKKAPARRRKPPLGENVAREYRFEYGKSRPNRFAQQLARDAVVVVLDPDVAKVFRDPRRVNALLRATIHAVERTRSRRAG